jgi:sarcosine oxidase subunit beta
MDNTFDAIVIGAGYIGSSIAYHLSKEGLKTALFDQGPFASGASRANYGNIQIQDLELEFSQELTLNGIKCFSTLEAELDWNLGFRKIGSLLPIETEKQWRILEIRKNRLNHIGIQSELVNAGDLRDIEPLIDRSVLLGGLYHSDEGQLDPFQLLWAYLTRAKQHGLCDFFHTPVSGLIEKNGKITAINTGKNTYYSNNVILCTGAYTNTLGRSVNKNWPIHYVLGQAYVTEPLSVKMHNHIASASFFEDSSPGDNNEVIANMAISQSGHGNILIGESMIESSGFDRRIKPQALPAIANCTLKYFPKFGKLRIFRSWSAPVADVPDGRPLLGPVESISGLYIASAFRSTVIITPYVGKLITQLITTGNCELDLSNFLPERKLNEAINEIR